jgi:formylglycine-generating enzyme required for sulfatase activity
MLSVGFGNRVTRGAALVSVCCAFAASLMAQAAEPILVLQVQKSAAATGPWSRVAEFEVPATQNVEFYRVAPPVTVEATVPAQYVWIPAGTFRMGTPDTEAGRRTAEGPQTRVRLSEGFWMSRYEITQREWEAVMPVNNSATPDPDLPADTVSYEEAMEFCAKLTAAERVAGRLPAGYVYRLPTEAEWEYACRAGTTTATTYGDSLSSTQANFDGALPYGGAAVGASLGRTVRGGQYPPNAWGLYDMDWHPSRLPGGRLTDPVGEGLPRLRAARGGGWHNDGATCRSGYRYLLGPIFRLSSSGLRPVIAREI